MNLVKEYESIMQEFKSQWPSKLFSDHAYYGNWLAQTYYFVCHSTALLGYALPHLKIPELRRRFEKHIGEEERHELMAKKDLENLGYSLEDFPELAETQAFYQSQYYRIQFEGGSSLLGYILFLEGMAVHWAKDVHDQVASSHKKGSHVFLRVHTTEDPHHLDEALKAIMSLPENEQVAILKNLRYSSQMYKQMMSSMQSTVTGNKHLRAA